MNSNTNPPATAQARWKVENRDDTAALREDLVLARRELATLGHRMEQLEKQLAAGWKQNAPPK